MIKFMKLLEKLLKCDIEEKKERIKVSKNKLL